MPIYTYRCTNCGVQFDQQQKFTDTALTRCPECNKKTLLKVFQPVGIVFKGSGFYATDHRSPSGQSRSGSKSNEGGNNSDSSRDNHSSGDSHSSGDKPAAPAKSSSSSESSSNNSGSSSGPKSSSES